MRSINYFKQLKANNTLISWEVIDRTSSFYVNAEVKSELTDIRDSTLLSIYKIQAVDLSHAFSIVRKNPGFNQHNILEVYPLAVHN